jgi:hypothetical protein
METYAHTVHFEKGTPHTPKGYVGDPYWPELNDVIDIQKKSGMNRARSTPNRRKALEEYLVTIGKTLDQYRELEKIAAMPFYRDPESNEIVIPEHCVMSFLSSTCNQTRSNSRPCEPEQVRSRFVVSPWKTGKMEADGEWKRFVVVSSGPGGKLSNQRSLRVNDYITDFDATGTISFDPDFVDPETLHRALDFGGRFIGIGASRKMGMGRFELRRFERVEAMRRAAE